MVKIFVVFLDRKPLEFQVIFLSCSNIQKEYSFTFLLSVISIKLLNFSQNYSMFVMYDPIGVKGKKTPKIAKSIILSNRGY